jgi:tripartite-type tricarboxylate transporter receptor subunit TctC
MLNLLMKLTEASINFIHACCKDTIIRKWNDEVNRALRASEVEERFKAAGLVAVGGSESAFATHFLQDTERWAAVIKAANIAIAP